MLIEFTVTVRIFKKYLNKCVLLLSLLILAGNAFPSVVKSKCDDTIILIKINHLDSLSHQFILSYKVNLHKQKEFYSHQADSIKVACIKDKKNHDLLLLEEFCSGSVCSDDGVYAVFDPNSKKMLIKFEPPSFDKHKNRTNLARYISDRLRYYEHRNHIQVAKLIGYTPPFLPETKGAFCCSRKQY